MKSSDIQISSACVCRTNFIRSATKTYDTVLVKYNSGERARTLIFKYRLYKACRSITRKSLTTCVFDMASLKKKNSKRGVVGV